MDDLISSHIIKKNDNSKCGSCRCMFDVGKVMCILKCNHFFCSNCVENMTHCPFCANENKNAIAQDTHNIMTVNSNTNDIYYKNIIRSASVKNTDPDITGYAKYGCCVWDLW